jgi:2-polyprenyl-3-methyl-5-hydroxy-6-metoxy-1,4-benzoquinol methylase
MFNCDRYIRDILAPKNYECLPLKGLEIADIGCGGGLLSEVYTIHN